MSPGVNSTKSCHQRRLYWERPKHPNAIGQTSQWNGPRAARMEKELRNLWIRTGTERKSNRAGTMGWIWTPAVEIGIAASQTVDQPMD
ncbi:hypothetical protein PoB_006794400 [Plakobranchus ocellatus]|uniref:Uncharacterized protein n=1 Tax=Plakobranchus ocellatus TaxID=259542 RepID=A0AAV4DB39_9GAST|nr:hypothetical protein PoB_006794400 [Plakobranchus ocellatus]